MPVLPFLIATLCVLAIFYRYYSAFIASKVLALDDKRKTPAITHRDNHSYYPTNKWVLFGHHFAAITGAGPLIGPVLAAQFGFLPGFLWLLIGVVLAGAVHDFVILSASIRHDGKSIAEIAKNLLGPSAGIVTSIAILFIVTIALAGLGVAFVNALSESAWGTFIIVASIPLAFVMGFYLHHSKSKNAVFFASLFGVLILLICVGLGHPFAESHFGQYFLLSKREITIWLAIYGFFASVLPVWILLTPRDYLSSYMKLGTIFLLIAAVFVVQPNLKMPMISIFANGNGPIIPGKLFPYVFITIACGAISGFHSLVSSGTTPKMVSKETDARMIGYGAMLCEGLVGIIALIATSTLEPADYFAINVPTEKFSQLGMHTTDLPLLEAAVRENVHGRTGGAVSLAVGMARIFSNLPFMQHLLSYWYHFAIMFEALFILTTIDAGTRIARFIFQEFFVVTNRRRLKKLGNHNSTISNILSSILVVFCWSYFIFTGSISTIWPLFGVANQLLACVALVIGTTYILKLNPTKKRYAIVTLGPLVFVSITTITAAIQNLTSGHQNIVQQFITVIMLFCVFWILGSGLKRWKHYL